jgi:hypothetical protein
MGTHDVRILVEGAEGAGTGGLMDSREYSMATMPSNGLAVTIRALRRDDRERVAAAVRLLDRESVYCAIIRRAFLQRALPKGLRDE